MHESLIQKGTSRFHSIIIKPAWDHLTPMYRYATCAQRANDFIDCGLTSLQLCKVRRQTRSTCMSRTFSRIVFLWICGTCDSRLFRTDLIKNSGKHVNSQLLTLVHNYFGKKFTHRCRIWKWVKHNKYCPSQHKTALWCVKPLWKSWTNAFYLKSISDRTCVRAACHYQ